MKGFYVYRASEDSTFAVDLSRVISILHTPEAGTHNLVLTLDGDSEAVYHVPAAHFLAHIYDKDRELYEDLLEALGGKQ